MLDRFSSCFGTVVLFGIFLSGDFLKHSFDVESLDWICIVHFVIVTALPPFDDADDTDAEVDADILARLVVLLFDIGITLPPFDPEDAA